MIVIPIRLKIELQKASIFVGNKNLIPNELILVPIHRYFKFAVPDYFKKKITLVYYLKQKKYDKINNLSRFRITKTSLSK